MYLSAVCKCMNSAQNTTYLLLDICQLELPTGGIQCLAYVPSWYFNAKKKRCLFFVYGGCGGNANNFGSLEDCIRRCMPQDERGS